MSHIQPHWPPGRGPACPLCRTKADAPCLLIRRHQPGQPPGTDADLIHVECIERAAAAVSHGTILSAIESQSPNATDHRPPSGGPVNHLVGQRVEGE